MSEDKGKPLGYVAMLRLVRSHEVYSPDTVTTMGVAFDKVCHSVPHLLDRDEEARCQLALIIIGQVNRGERNPVKISELAINELAPLPTEASQG